MLCVVLQELVRVIYTNSDLSSLSDTSKYPGTAPLYLSLSRDTAISLCVGVLQGMPVSWQTSREE